MKIHLRHMVMGLLAGILSVFFCTSSALAAVYGGDNYNNCEYSRDCSNGSSSTPSSSASQAPSASNDSGTAVVLNDYNEYFTAKGKQLNLSTNDVVYFFVLQNNLKEKHSVTILEITDDAVTFAVNSTPQKATLRVSQNQSFDVTSDGHNDIEVTLLALSNRTATFSFKNLQTATTKVTKTEVPARETDRSWIIYALSLLVGVGIFVILFVRRRRRGVSTDL